MDKKPTISVLKAELDKLKFSFENDKKEKDETIGRILTVIEDLGVTLNTYGKTDVENGESGYGDVTNEDRWSADLEEKMMTKIEAEIERRWDIERVKNDLEKKIQSEHIKHLEDLQSKLENELKRKDAEWQQKYDLMTHELHKIGEIGDQSSSLIDESRIYRENNGKRETMDVVVQNKKDEELIIKFAPLTEFAQKPLRGSEHDAGIDLRSAYEYMVPARGNKLIKTDWKIEFPEGYFGKICSRSGLSLNHNIETGAGVVDFGYRGGVNVVLNNLSGKDFYVAPGDRIAQLVCTPYITPSIKFCNPGDIPDTVRGSGGFGSTGIK
jgi:dUTP pyrophosphatase